jgi:hypothetical protein
MAVKGPAYVKTSWSFEERPVASSKLNTWDDRIEAALELICFLVSMSWGGGNGVLRNAAADDLRVTALSAPGLSVQVQPGYAFISRFPYKLVRLSDTPAITPPSVNPRIDLVQACLETWSVNIKTGTEAVNPNPPSADNNCMALAHLYLRPGMTCITNADDGANGYIVDARTFV